MTKNIINFIVTIILAIILSQFLPWWSVMVAAFATGLFFSLKRASVFVVPFLAITLFWVAYSFWLSSTNDFILAKKMAVLLPLNGNAYLLILVTGIIGGLAAGVAGIFGKQCVTLLSKS
ncbi:hypothetical protein [Xanthomarina sp. F2636L]|uniref:hypothetical protein n=1 Tax=Xanthomarina sp. F2636L TaxID=2996018 RepID=UPI00225DEF3A|nr:hypothetical protein [Xanthomarina sp. F2636L]MCX7551402.1 hypothetical protein [Xanthomarina sp. F2636L]